MVVIIFALIVPPLTTLAHSGKTDANGGHRDNKNKSGLGSYHYHCGGNPPHLHGANGCPYETSPVSSNNQESASSVEIIEKPTNLVPGEKFYLKHSVHPQNVINKDITWESSDESVARVDNEGVITTYGIGTAIITATTSNDKTTSFELIVEEVIAESLSIKDKPSKMTNIQGIPLYVELVPGNTTSKEIIWTSSDPSIVQVDETGYLKALSEGTVTITAIQKDSFDSFEITVDEITVEKISIGDNPDKIKNSEEIILKAELTPKNTTSQEIKWTFSDTSIAEINESGYLKAKSPGIVTITATQKDIVDSFELTVEAIIPSGIEIVNDNDKLKVGETINLKAIVSPKNADDKKVTWRVDNNEIATIENSVLTAKKPGTVTITATTINDKTDSFQIEMTSSPEAVVANWFVLVGGGVVLVGVGIAASGMLKKRKRN